MRNGDAPAKAIDDMQYLSVPALDDDGGVQIDLGERVEMSAVLAARNPQRMIQSHDIGAVGVRGQLGRLNGAWRVKNEIPPRQMIKDFVRTLDDLAAFEHTYAVGIVRPGATNMSCGMVKITHHRPDVMASRLTTWPLCACRVVTY
jgi:hypothetical protein